MAGLVPVRQHASIEDMHAAQKEVRARLFGPARANVVSLPVGVMPPPKVHVPTRAEIKRMRLEAAQATSDVIRKQREARDEAVAALRAEKKSLHVILRIVSAVTGLSRDHIAGPRRTAPAVKARQISMWLMRSCTTKSLRQVAVVNGRSDHSTVSHGVGVVRRIIRDHNIPLTADVADMAQRLWDADWRARKAA